MGEERKNLTKKHQPQNKPKTGRFQPGKSGNPGGRPKVIREVIDLAREHTTLAIETLAKICKSADKDSARVAAANALLDRAWGRAPQTIELQGKDGAALLLNPNAVAQLTDEELMAKAGEILAQRAGAGRTRGEA
jgi:hypothetical protein